MRSSKLKLNDQGHDVHHVLKEDIVVWKKALTQKNLVPVIVKLLVPKGTRVFNGSRGVAGKCRAAEAKVLSISYRCYDSRSFAWRRGSNCRTAIRSTHDPNFFYQVGETVKPKHGFSRSFDECAGGIHFFHTYQQAADY